MKTYNLKNHTIVLNKIVFISGVFLDDAESAQFNVKLIGDKLSFKFTNRADAVLQRELLVKALNDE
jgi:hypothetical protein